jgi:hypothetical protein
VDDPEREGTPRPSLRLVPLAGDPKDRQGRRRARRPQEEAQPPGEGDVSAQEGQHPDGEIEDLGEGD